MLATIHPMLNVIQRKIEIGIMRATGFGSWKIARLFFARALLSGFNGAVLGFILATWIGMEYGPWIFKVTSISVKPLFSLLYWSIIVGSFFSVLAAFISIVFALKQEPAEVLKEI